MALRLHEIGEDFQLLFTPTGNELPEVLEHIQRIVAKVGKPLILPTNKTLGSYISEYNALPNWRQRWCTRQIKIVPCIDYLKTHPGSTLLVGLRADEEARTGLYGDYATYRYPLREWGWGVKQVWDYLAERNVTVPRRTDCAVCYGQRISEWYELWRDHPKEYAQGEAWEAQTGHTFRSPSRDTWSAALVDLRKEFEGGRVPKGVRAPVGSDLDDEEDEAKACRVCRL